MNKFIALRIDVDTLRGTARGVSRICEILAGYGVRGTFYFSLGPDNMGRHLWRLLRPAFLWKMLRTDAAGLYGPEIILMGTAWPGPQIWKHCAAQIRAAGDAGHESGLHAWDHHRAQAALGKMSPEELRRGIGKGLDKLKQILGAERICTSAAPGWRCNDALLKVKAEYPFAYNSDCRGFAPFYPVVDGEKLPQMQIPVTLPTYDEALGRNGVTDANYNDFQISLLREDRPNVLTVHAEAEGGKCAAMFDRYLKEVAARGYRVGTLGELMEETRDSAPAGTMKLEPFPGREGGLAVQQRQ